VSSIQGRVEKDLEAILNDGYHLYGVKVSKSGKSPTIDVYIDCADGLNLDDCSKLHRSFKELDEERDGGPLYDDFQVTFSSPGIERDLIFPVDFQFHNDKKFEFQLESGSSVSGKVSGLDLKQQNIEVETKQGLVKLEWNDVKRARFALFS